MAFDPDHIPEPAFSASSARLLRRSEVGYVQAAQVYYNQPASFIARGAAEETYAYYSSLQMTSYAINYPIVTGCHNSHRVTALKEVGGFAPHEADDLLITINYRVAGWRGVYVPEILARGINPVDWPRYLNQQRRWARSVLDVKFRIFPKVARQLPIAERLISTAHGLYYIQGLVTAIGVGLLSFMLVSGERPRTLSATLAPRVLALIVVLQLCEFYRQRFYLDRRTEWGINWRAKLLRFAKWPHILRGLYEALFRPAAGYAMTTKDRQARRSHVLARAHLPGITLIVLAWLAGIAIGTTQRLGLILFAFVAIATTIAIVLTELLDYPDPYQQELADEDWVRPRTHPLRRCTSRKQGSRRPATRHPELRVTHHKAQALTFVTLPDRFAPLAGCPAGQFGGVIVRKRIRGVSDGPRLGVGLGRGGAIDTGWAREPTSALVSVIIPTLNEAENLRYVIPRLPLEYELIVVDGGSSDDTMDVARELRPEATVMLQTGRGKGDALCCGFLWPRLETSSSRSTGTGQPGPRRSPASCERSTMPTSPKDRVSSTAAVAPTSHS